ncbi:MAG: GNAT family N-acetyltransferase [Candidatus Diapherotrites archaeon]|nr:GNAT family N-acetyltransferase [Candidatus Diapherotrites archaeon]
MLNGRNVMLRGLELKDAEILWHYMNKENVQKYLNATTAFALEDEQDFVKKTWEGRKNGTKYTFGIVEKATGKLIGAAGIEVRGQRVGELGLWIGDDYWGKGYGTEALKLIIKYGFEAVDMYKLYAGGYEDNKATHIIQERAGLKYEYTAKKERYKHGKWHNGIYRCLFKEEYLQAMQEEH